MEGGPVGHNFERGPARFGLIWFSGFRGEDLNAIFYLTCITGFFMNFELLPILTDYAN
jgi:hypothetical protein